MPVCPCLSCVCVRQILGWISRSICALFYDGQFWAIAGDRVARWNQGTRATNSSVKTPKIDSALLLICPSAGCFCFLFLLQMFLVLPKCSPSCYWYSDYIPFSNWGGLQRVALMTAVARKALIKSRPYKKCAEGLMQNWLHQQLRVLRRRNLGASYTLNNAKQPSSTRCSPEDANHSRLSWSAVKSVSLVSTYRLVRDARGISEKIRTLFTPSLRKERRRLEWAIAIIVTVIICIAKALNHAQAQWCGAECVLLTILPAFILKGLVQCATGKRQKGLEE